VSFDEVSGTDLLTLGGTLGSVAHGRADRPRTTATDAAQRTMSSEGVAAARDTLVIGAV
jgi:hypothetical protein